MMSGSLPTCGGATVFACVAFVPFCGRRGWPPATASLPAAAALEVAGVLAQRGGRAAERGGGAGKAEGRGNRGNVAIGVARRRPRAALREHGIGECLAHRLD